MERTLDHPRRVLLVTVAWPANGNHNIYTDLAQEFVQQGHEVTVVCANERRNATPTGLSYEGGVGVLRVRCGNVRETNKYEKAISAALLGRQMDAAIRKHLREQRFQLIMCSTPPITLAGLIRSLKERNRAKVYLLLKDIWPQAPVDLGAMKRGSLVWRYFRHQEQAMYRVADFVGCMSPANVRYVLKNNPELSDKCVKVCPNSELPRPRLEVDRAAVRQQLGVPPDSTVFVFGGNLGKPQGVGFLLDVIDRLKDRRDVYFLIVGGGTEAAYVKARLASLKPQCARYFERLPREQYEGIVSASDVGLILLDNCFTIPNFPSRLLAYLQARMPILAAVDGATDIGEIIVQNECGLAVSHGDVASFVSAVDRLAADSESRVRMGDNGRDLFEREYTTATSYRVIMNHFTN